MGKKLRLNERKLFHVPFGYMELFVLSNCTAIEVQSKRNKMRHFCRTSVEIGEIDSFTRKSNEERKENKTREKEVASGGENSAKSTHMSNLLLIIERTCK